MNEFYGEGFTVKHARQNEVNDIFEVVHDDEKRDDEYLTFPRTMEMTCEDVAEWVDVEAVA